MSSRQISKVVIWIFVAVWRQNSGVTRRNFAILVSRAATDATPRHFRHFGNWISTEVFGRGRQKFWTKRCPFETLFTALCYASFSSVRFAKIIPRWTAIPIVPYHTVLLDNGRPGIVRSNSSGFLKWVFLISTITIIPLNPVLINKTPGAPAMKYIRVNIRCLWREYQNAEIMTRIEYKLCSWKLLTKIFWFFRRVI